MRPATIGAILFAFAGCLLLVSIMAAARTVLLDRKSPGVPYVPSVLAFVGALLTRNWTALLVIAIIDIGTVIAKGRMR
jgi:hypothetical protein